MDRFVEIFDHYFSQCNALILKMKLLKIFTEPLLRLLRPQEIIIEVAEKFCFSSSFSMFQKSTALCFLIL